MTRDAPARAGRREWIGLAVIALPCLLYSMDLTVLHLAVPKLSAEFLTNFDRFNLTAQEGYLISLIDGRMDLQKLLVLSPFDPFTTLFNLAKLQHERAITIPQ